MEDMETPRSLEGNEGGKAQVETMYDFAMPTANPRRRGCLGRFCCNSYSKGLLIAITLFFAFSLIVLANNNADSAFRYAFTVDIRTSRLENDMRKFTADIASFEQRLEAIENRIGPLKEK